jgi:poly(hydroxyalkanoate) depolymerase family esterase
MNRNAIADTIERALSSAGITMDSPTMGSVAATIRKALTDAGLTRPPNDAPLHVVEEPAVDNGSFTSHAFAIGGASRDYKLYVPTGARREAAPLLVMLHGCTQQPDDFAIGTRMNELAQEYGFLVAYPAQARRANGSNCWNWFEADQQLRSGEEASLIAGIAQDIVRSHHIDGRRVFVAGLSAGGAMALVLGATYPDVFAGVGVHSGVALGTAHDMGSAFAAMRGQARPKNASDLTARPPVRTIVVHGDADPTVHVSNAEQIVTHARQAFDAQPGAPLRALAGSRRAMQGREVTTTHWIDASGVAQIAHWVIHGAAHAWSGGNPEGSYTDARGPDASQAIVQFLLDPQRVN